jgi:DNA-binding NarL/FixJ family response regulator
MSHRLRVLVVDDFAPMRQIMVELISGDPALEVVGEARDAVDAMIRFKELLPDVVVLDVGMPSLSGLEIVPMMHSAKPDAKIIVVTLLPENYYRKLAQRARVTGFIPKHELMDKLIGMIRGASSLPHSNSAIRPESLG